MASKRMDLSKRTFFVLSGVSNQLGKTLALEMCRRFHAGSAVLLVDISENDLQEVKKEIHFLERNIDVICCAISGGWQNANGDYFQQMFATILQKYASAAINFELAFVVHNEGHSATRGLIEPQSTNSWLAYVNEQLYAPVALNQQFLGAPQLCEVEKLVVNITSSLMVRPFVYNTLMCSSMKARDMYFRAMANEEGRSDVSVISYSPGLLESHKPQLDLNNNVIDLLDLDVDEEWLKLPRVSAQRTTLKLINILEEMSFISGHDVDYYDTFVL